MKPSEFKKILKPLIKQTVREVILEEGILSNIVSEVARGMQGAVMLETVNKKSEDLARKEQELENNRQEKIKRLNESSRMKADLFSGTQPAPESGRSPGPLTNISPADAGIDITNIEKLANGKWKRLI